MTERQMKELNDSYRMAGFIRKYFESRQNVDVPDPTSNTQMRKALQEVVDAILFMDDGAGKNMWKVNNHDVAYLNRTYSKRGGKKDGVLTVSVATHSTCLTLLVDVLHHMVTNTAYGVGTRTQSKKGGERVPAKLSEATLKAIGAKDAAELAAACAPTEAPADAPKKAKKSKKVEAAVEVVEAVVEAPSEAVSEAVEAPVEAK